mmetsp:Transcript_31174/g.55076  ORF Transcript_31174/g.55076 Transcript_31174/m.55076 type:complete len:216 (-) Transcript_31174:334-981(-)
MVMWWKARGWHCRGEALVYRHRRHRRCAWPCFQRWPWRRQWVAATTHCTWGKGASQTCHPRQHDIFNSPHRWSVRGHWGHDPMRRRYVRWMRRLKRHFAYHFLYSYLWHLHGVFLDQGTWHLHNLFFYSCLHLGYWFWDLLDLLSRYLLDDFHRHHLWYFHQSLFHTRNRHFNNSFHCLCPHQWEGLVDVLYVDSRYLCDEVHWLDLRHLHWHLF